MNAKSIPIRDNPAQHRFEADLGDGSIAIAEYRLEPGRITFTHTVVPPEHEGQGIGSALIRYALDSARDRHLKVVPICKFFAAHFKRHSEDRDLLDEGEKGRLGLA